MKSKRNFDEIIEEIVIAKSCYKREAYYFVMSALNYYLNKIDERRHVTGQELLKGISEYAKQQFGPMVLTVFEHWGLKKTDDFGKIVYHLIERGLLSKQEKDSLQDFNDVYNFNEEFKYDIGVQL